MENKQKQLHKKRHQKKKKQQRLFLGFILLLIILLIFGAIKIFGKSKSPQAEEEPLANSPTESAGSDENTPHDSSTLLEKIKSYSDTMYLSKVEIYNHLLEENFTVEEIQNALKELSIDYKNNALLRARGYQNTMNMSPDAIYEKLVGEFGDGFTPDEGQYALDNL